MSSEAPGAAFAHRLGSRARAVTARSVQTPGAGASHSGQGWDFEGFALRGRRGEVTPC